MSTTDECELRIHYCEKVNIGLLISLVVVVILSVCIIIYLIYYREQHQQRVIPFEHRKQIVIEPILTHHMIRHHTSFQVRGGTPQLEISTPLK
jgi:preprotein translocase subunit SecY